jgi:type IV secretory pathway VirB9-like protein
MKKWLLVLSVFTSPAMAQVTDAGHNLEADYADNKVYNVTMQYGLQCLVTVNPTEQLLRAPGLDDPNKPVSTVISGAKDGPPIINNIPLMGSQPGLWSVIFVTKDRQDREHTYTLLVKVVKPPADGDVAPNVCLRLKFNYTAAQLAATALPTVANPTARQISWKEQADAKRQEVAKARLATDVWYGPHVSDGWHAQGRYADILPSMCFTNTRLTLCRFPGNMTTPAFFEVTDPPGTPSVCQGKKPTEAELHAPESAMTTSRYDDYIQINQSAQHFRVRQGEFKVGEIWFCNYDPVGSNPGTGTDSPDVVRRVITQR